MGKTTMRWVALLGWGCAVGSAPLLVGQAAAWAQDNNAGNNAPTAGGHDQAAVPIAASEELVTAPFTVEDVDRAHRRVAVRSPDGDRMTVDVPSDVAGFDKLKKGDKIDVDYYKAVAVSLLPAGSAPGNGAPERSQRMASNNGNGQATRGRQVTSSVQVVSLNPQDNTMQVKGSNGKTQTVTVDDPALQKKLQVIKPGDVVQVTYTEAIAAAIRPRSNPNNNNNNNSGNQ
jgi:hypothetical protein